MRTLLNESLPPHCDAASAFAQPRTIQPSRRIFSEKAVLATNEPNLVEVGGDGPVIANPGAGAASAHSAPGCGVAALRADAGQTKESPAL